MPGNRHTSPPRFGGDQPRVKKRKQRATYSCAECRRLKLKCDRKVPCGNCVRRNCLDLCPSGTRPVRGSDSAELRDRLDMLEKLLSTSGIVVPVTEDDSVPESRESGTNTPLRPQPPLPEPSDHHNRSSRPERRSGLDRATKSNHSQPFSSPNTSTQDHRALQQDNPEACNQQLDIAAVSPPDTMHPTQGHPGAGHVGQVGHHFVPMLDVEPVRFDYSDVGPQSQQPMQIDQPPVQDSGEGAGTGSGPASARASGSGPVPDDQPSYGVLVVTSSGRSKYLGPTAAGEWLMDQETQEQQTPSVSRAQSPHSVGEGRSVRQSHPSGLGSTITAPGDRQASGYGRRSGSSHVLGQPHTYSHGGRAESHALDSLDVFPFGGERTPVVTTEYLLANLPPLDEACVFVDAYYRYFSWNYDVSPRQTFQPVFERVFNQAASLQQNMYRHPNSLALTSKEGTAAADRAGTSTESEQGAGSSLSLHEIALVFITMAFGALYNLELQPNDPIADEYFALAKCALGKGSFLTSNNIATVQTLHIMAHFCLETERGRNGDMVWPMWGIGMRIIQAMGLHRDPSRWNLPQDVCEERRRIFWECHAADVFQSNCFSRPNGISSDYFDVGLPNEMVYSRNDGAKGFSTLKFELCRIAERVLRQAMTVQPPSYASVMELHEQLMDFEKQIPYHLRCRAALLAMTSRYPDTEAAILDSPDETRRDLHRTFQQFTLYLNVTEAVMVLHRPYYVRALAEGLDDPTRSIYGESYLTLVERCNVIIQLATRLYALHPTVSARHWNYWFHSFNAAVSVGTLILKTPRNPLALFALSLIDSCIQLYTSAIQVRRSRRMVTNLQWLLKLRQRAGDRISREAGVDNSIAAPESGTGKPRSTIGAGGEESDRSEDSEGDVELVGWRTRLIQRAAKGKFKATNISSSSGGAYSGSPVTSIGSHPSPNAALSQTIKNALQQHFAPGMNLSSGSAFGAGGGGTGSGTSAMPGLVGPDANLGDGVSPQGSQGESTDAMLAQFWDPVLLQGLPDIFTDSLTNEWEWESSM